MQRDCKECIIAFLRNQSVRQQGFWCLGNTQGQLRLESQWLRFDPESKACKAHDFDFIQLIRLRDDAESLGMNLIFNANALRCLGLGSHIIFSCIAVPMSLPSRFLNSWHLPFCADFLRWHSCLCHPSCTLMQWRAIRGTNQHSLNKHA